MGTVAPPSPSPPKASRWRRLRFHSAKASSPATAVPSAAAVDQRVWLKHGFLLKKGHRVPTTKERFFVLQPRVLSYYRVKQHASDASSTAAAVAAASTVDGLSTVDARQLRGVIELAPSDLITPMATSRHWFLIQKLPGPDGKSYKLELRASSPDERQQWIDALRAAARELPVAAVYAAREAERERQLTRTLTMLRVRDASLLSTVLRQQQHAPNAATNTLGTSASASASVVDLRASFQVFHELVLLQSLVATVQREWGPPATWSCAQYDSLVESIALAAHQAPGVATSFASDSNRSVLGDARALQYAFEDVPSNQQKLLARRAQALADGDTGDVDGVAGEDAPPTPSPLLRLSLRGSYLANSSTNAAVTGRVRCPTIYSYLSTFERFVPVHATENEAMERLSDDATRTSSVSSSGTTSARSSLNGPALSPRSATLAKYAHLYLEEEGRSRTPWSWDRRDGDDLFDANDNETNATDARLAQALADRFGRDHVYAYARPRTLLFVNPNRVLKTHKFTSIYDERVVLTYAQTPFAPTQLAPHPFAMAKQALFRLFFAPTLRQSLVLTGDSGSGKTELAKELLKYVVLTAQPSTTTRQVVVYTSSTKSTFQMRHDEARTLDLLHAKGITDYTVVLLDLAGPDAWNDRTVRTEDWRLREQIAE